MDVSPNFRRAKFWKQFCLVVDAYAAAGLSDVKLEVAPIGARPGGDVRTLTSESPDMPGYVYEKDVLLVRAEHLDDVMREVPAARLADSDRRVPSGVRLMRLASNDEDDRSTVFAALGHLNARRAEGLPLPPGAATPNHIVSICHVNLCPADEPVSILGNPLSIAHEGRPDPPLRNEMYGQGVSVKVIDTGLVTNWRDHTTVYPWLSGADGEPRVAEIDGVDKGEPGSDKVIEEYVGHGLFIAGVVRSVARQATVHVDAALQHAGAMLESDLGPALLYALGPGEWPDIISLSAGVTSVDGSPLVGLCEFMSELHNRPGTVLVAAAGNEQSDAPFYPAAYANDIHGELPAVVSVGALGIGERERACFSNFGDWVKVYARGDKMMNAFAVGNYTNVHEPGKLCNSDALTPPGGTVQEFSGMARWSGTSFATPLVAGLIAARMSVARAAGTPETSRQAATWLLIKAQAQSVPGVGPVLKASQELA